MTLCDCANLMLKTTLIIDENYLYHSLKITPDHIFNLQTRENVLTFFKNLSKYLRINVKEFKKYMGIDFTQKVLLFTKNNENNSFDLNCWPGFEIFMDICEGLNPSFCEKCKAIHENSEKLNLENLVNLTNWIVTNSNKKISNNINENLVIIGKYNKFQNIIRLAQKYKNNIILIEDQKSCPIENILNYEIKEIVKKEVLKEKSELEAAFMIADTNGRKEPDYVIGLKGVRSNIPLKELKDLLARNNVACIYSKRKVDKEMPDCFFCLFGYDDRKTALKALTLVFQYIL